MSDIEIVNPVPPDEMVGWTATLATTFLRKPDPEGIEAMAGFWADRLEPARTWGARAGGRWVATLATEPRLLSVPGGDGGTRELAVDALTAVTTNATHRRRGLLSSMLGASLRSAKERGDPLSILIAAEWPIYGRFGYGPAVRRADFEYGPRRPRAAVPAEARGAVRQVTLAEMDEVGPAVYDRARRLRVGQIDRPAFWWKRSRDDSSLGPYNLFVHEQDGAVDGLLAWQPSGDFDIDGSMGTVDVVELIAATDVGYQNLWAYLSGLDVVETVKLANRPADEPIRWQLADGRALRETYAGDQVWARLLDVPAALSARGYRTPGRVVLEVVDDAEGGYARGRYVLDAGPDGASCTRTTESADVRLPATVLASVYLGGYRLRPIAAAGLVDEVTPGALERLDAMFAVSLEPWCATGF
jgi:predicted acetyltransferase